MPVPLLLHGHLRDGVEPGVELGVCDGAFDQAVTLLALGQQRAHELVGRDLAGQGAQARQALLAALTGADVLESGVDLLGGQALGVALGGAALGQQLADLVGLEAGAGAQGLDVAVDLLEGDVHTGGDGAALGDALLRGAGLSSLLLAPGLDAHAVGTAAGELGVVEGLGLDLAGQGGHLFVVVLAWRQEGQVVQHLGAREAPRVAQGSQAVTGFLGLLGRQPQVAGGADVVVAADLFLGPALQGLD
jgi:hypothetical protein